MYKKHNIKIKKELKQILHQIEEECGICERELCELVDDEIYTNPHLKNHRENPSLWMEIAHKNSKHRGTLDARINLAKNGKLSDEQIGELILNAAGYKKVGVNDYVR